MVAEVFAGISGFKAMLDIAKSLKDMNDAAARKGVVIELQEQILAAQETQATLTEQVGTLKAHIAKFETWDAEKKKYELKDLGWGAFAFMLRPEARNGEPPHWVCTNCYGNGRISIIQNTQRKRKEMRGYFCPACQAEITPSQVSLDGDGYKWLD
jgi:hypothetical protein